MTSSVVCSNDTNNKLSLRNIEQVIITRIILTTSVQHNCKLCVAVSRSLVFKSEITLSNGRSNISSKCICLHRSGTVVKVLCYKSEGRWFYPSWCQWIFH